MGDIKDKGVKKYQIFEKTVSSSGSLQVAFHVPVRFSYGSFAVNTAYTSNSNEQYNSITTSSNDLAFRIRERDLRKIDSIDFGSDLRISRVVVENLPELKYLGISDASGLTSLNIAPLQRMRVLWVEKIPNITIDLSLNPELVIIAFIQTNAIPQLVIDKMYADLVAHGKLNGELNLTRTGTPAGDANRAILVSRGWTIDNNYV